MVLDDLSTAMREGVPAAAVFVQRDIADSALVVLDTAVLSMCASRPATSSVRLTNGGRGTLSGLP
jgi:hypothetical protein